MTHDDATLTKLLRQGWRGDTASDLMREAADRIDQLTASAATAVAELDKIEDRAPHDIDGMIYTIPWAEGVIAGSKRVRRILTTGSAEQEST